MMTRSQTKDERFLLEAYARSQDSLDEPPVLDRYDVGEAVGLSTRAVNAIFQGLSQANFVKKEGKSEFRITAHGVRLARELLK